MREWVRVYTYKTGLLSPVAHDLQLSLEKWDLRRDHGDLVFEAWTDRLRIDGPVVRGRLEPRGISDKDRRKIKSNIDDKILDIQRNPRVVFRGRERRDRIEGTLLLRGQSVEISIPTTESKGQLRGEVTIRPSLWGIRPFKALGGAIKLLDRVRVAFCLHTGP